MGENGNAGGSPVLRGQGVAVRDRGTCVHQLNGLVGVEGCQTMLSAARSEWQQWWDEKEGTELGTTSYSW
jgi:hypothetical protein